MNYLRIGLYILAGVLVALLAGFVWGRSGRSALQAHIDDTELRLDLADGRADLLAARVDLFEVNFGRASQQLQAARPPLQDAERRLTAAGRADDARRVKDVAARIAQAQEEAGRLDQSANTRLAETVVLLDAVIASAGKK